MTKLVIDGLIAFGTVAVAVLAIWSDWFRSKLAPAKLTLIGHTLDGEPTNFASGTRAMFYHLKVINQRRWLPAQNCRVMLVGLSRRDPGGVFQPIPMAVSWQFVWAPAEFTPSTITLLKEQVLDFGYVEEHGNRFIPRLYVAPNNFQGFVGPNDAVRFQLQIEAVNFSSRIVIEVAWDGAWDYAPATMKQHLPIRIITT
jgi:hypothetical protein